MHVDLQANRYRNSAIRPSLPFAPIGLRHFSTIFSKLHGFPSRPPVYRCAWFEAVILPHEIVNAEMKRDVLVPIAWPKLRAC